VHPTSGEKFHARDCFTTLPLGYKFEDLPSPPKQQMREPPYYAIFKKISVLQLEKPRVCYCFVAGVCTQV